MKGRSAEKAERSVCHDIGGLNEEKLFVYIGCGRSGNPDAFGMLDKKDGRAGPRRDPRRDGDGGSYRGTDSGAKASGKHTDRPASGGK